MEYLSIQDPSGEPMRAPYLIMQLNSNQQFCIMGVDFSTYGPVDLNEEDLAIKSDPIGKLHELDGAELQGQVVDFMMENGWNFNDYPDPEIIMMSLNTVLDAIIPYQPAFDEYHNEYKYFLVSYDHLQIIHPAFMVYWKEPLPTWRQLMDMVLARALELKINRRFVIEHGIIRQGTMGKRYKFPSEVRAYAISTLNTGN